MFTTIDRYCSECLMYTNSFNPHTPMKSGATMNSHFTGETAEAQGGEMAWPRLNGWCFYSGFKTEKSGSRRLSYDHLHSAACRGSWCLLTTPYMWLRSSIYTREIGQCCYPVLQVSLGEELWSAQVTLLQGQARRTSDSSPSLSLTKAGAFWASPPAVCPM